MPKYPSPTPAQVRAWRDSAHLTQQQAAELLHTSLSAYQQWEYGTRPMHPAFWELARIKTLDD